MRKWKDISLCGWDSTIEAANRIFTTVSDDEILAEADTIRAKRKEEEERKAKINLLDWVALGSVIFKVTETAGDYFSGHGVSNHHKKSLTKITDPTKIAMLEQLAAGNV